MTQQQRWHRLKARLRSEVAELVRINPSDRPWQMPFAAALATGLPLLVGAYFDHMDYGLISSLGGLTFVYLPNTPLYHRMVSLMACAFGMAACYALGVISHLFPPAMMLALSFTAILVTMVCRFYNLGPPGSLFFIMAASIGAYTPGGVLDVPLKVGLLTMGSLLACLIAFIYSVYILRQRPPGPVMPLPSLTFDSVVFDSVVVGLFVGASLALAQVLQLEKAYWVPVSCLAVIQGMSLRAAWTKQLHRVAGTCIGLLVSLGLLMLPLNNWSISAVMIVLAFVIETAVVRHYGFAAIFITPMTIMLAEASTLGHGSSAVLIEARFYDTVLGCLVGFAGAACLHSPRFRELAGSRLRQLIPARPGR